MGRKRWSYENPLFYEKTRGIAVLSVATLLFTRQAKVFYNSYKEN
jgi:hypothetical protein